MTSELALLKERFQYLQKKWDHIPRGRSSELERISRFMGQVEMFYLAQAICSRSHPELQQELDQLRRDVMDEVNNGPLEATGGIYPTQVRQSHHWTDFQLTPELALDPALTGRFVSAGKIRRLNQILKLQIQTVLKEVGR